ncbi:hypothetical protein GCM10008941_29890 [Rhizomicrobium palustre]
MWGIRKARAGAEERGGKRGHSKCLKRKTLAQTHSILLSTNQHYASQAAWVPCGFLARNKLYQRRRPREGAREAFA